jgi:hypothetical protein
MSKKRKGVLWDNGDWAVTTYGVEHMSHPPYGIARERLWENEPKYSWDRHLAGKLWVNLPAFIEAWEAAKQLHARHRPKVAA